MNENCLKGKTTLGGGLDGHNNRIYFITAGTGNKFLCSIQRYSISIDGQAYAQTQETT